jgi:ATP/maltotriose-dependent transcriptional regulator MalT
LGDSGNIANGLQDLATVEILQGKYEAAEARIDESLVLAQAIGSTRIIADGMGMKGEVEFWLGNFASAETYIMKSLALYRTTGGLHHITLTLSLLSGVAYARAEVERTVVLLGALERMLPTVGISLLINARIIYDRTLSAVKPRLEEEPFIALFSIGQQMSAEAAVAYALRESEVGNALRPITTSNPALPPTHITSAPRSTQPFHSAYVSGLTPREIDVLELIASGSSNEEIASKLVLSVRTVERHINSLYQKIGVTGRAARAKATAFALQQGSYSLH